MAIGFSSLQMYILITLKLTLKKVMLNGGSKISGSSHEGNISIQEGVISINHGNMVNAEFVVDLNTITCTDLREKAAYLVDHLKNEDFLMFRTILSSTKTY